MVAQTHNGPRHGSRSNFREGADRTTVELSHHGIPAGSPGEAVWAAALDHLATRTLSAWPSTARSPVV